MPLPAIDAQMSPHQNQRRVIVVGGGISGLAAAHRLHELEPHTELTLLEASGRLGGSLHTERRDGFLIEQGADSFITNVPWAVDLCRRIGFDRQLIRTQKGRRQASVVRKGRLHPVPEGFLLMAPSRMWPLLTSSILSPLGKARLACEALIPRRRDGAEESLAQFARRRLGRETFERLVQPLIGGIYTADPEKLSLSATLPRFVEMEERYGSLTRGALAERMSRSADRSSSGARYSQFVTPRDGLSTLAAAIAERLPLGSIRLNSGVAQLRVGEQGQWQVILLRTGERLEADGLILATPAPVAASLLERLHRQLADELREIPHASTAVVSLGYKLDQFPQPPDGFGFVVPTIEDRKILSASFSSNKFPGRAPDGHILIRVFIGGACQSQLLRGTDDDLVKIATDELISLLGVPGWPMLTHVARWTKAMPQYHLGHEKLVERIEQRVAAFAPIFALAGNAYRGVGIPHSIRSGERAAELLLNYRAPR